MAATSEFTAAQRECRPRNLSRTGRAFRLARCGERKRTIKICTKSAAEAEIAAFEALGARLVALGPALERPLTEREKPPFWAPPRAPADEAKLAQGRTLVTPLLGPSPVEADELLRQSRLTPALLTTILLEPEPAGRSDLNPSNRILLVESKI